MAQTDPWAPYRPQNQAPAQQPLPVEPQPFPGAQPITVRRNPAKVASENQAQIRTNLDINQDARANEALRMENERLRISQADAERRERTATANQGVDTSASQDKAAGHVTALTTELSILDDVRGKDPEALRPSWGEKVAGTFTNDPDYLSFTKSTQRQRASAAYRNIIESALYLKTGAAYNQEQLEGQIQAMVPQMADDDAVLQDKALRLKAIIEAARAESGPADLKTQEALSKLEGYLPLMYSSHKGALEAKMAQPVDNKLSTTHQAVEIPVEMQREYMEWLSQKPAGSLKVEDYLRFRQELDQKYGFDPSNSYAGADEWVKAYNQTGDVKPLPAANEPLGEWGRAAAGVVGSEAGTATKSYVNAAGFGIPELLAGRGGRIASDLADEANPNSALAGDIVGSIMPSVALEQLAAKGLGRFVSGNTARSVMADVTGNAAYGGIRGATEADPGDRATGALSGSAFGAGGSLAARGLVKGARGFMPETKAQSLDALGPIPYDTPAGAQTIPGVDMTTLQRAGLADTEEAIQGAPFVHGAREAAVESWNRHNSSRVLARIGESIPDNIRPGQDMNAYVNTKLNQAYSALRPRITGAIDPNFDTAVAALRRSAVGGSAERRALWQEIEDALQKFRKPDGTFDGEGYRELSTQLRRLGDVWTSNNVPAMTTAAQDMARVAEQVRKQAQALVGRTDPEVGRRLKNIEGAWAHQVRIEGASRGAAKATRGVYAPDEYLNSIERLDTSKNKSMVARGRGFDQPYAQNAREALGGKPAKRASIKETAVGMAAIGFGGPVAATIASGLGLGYIPGIKRGLQAIIDGKLGQTPEAISKALRGTKLGNDLDRAIGAEGRQRLLTQLIRAKAQQSTEK